MSFSSNDMEQDSRRQLFTQIFGIERPLSPPPSNVPRELPDSLDMMSLKAVLNEDVENDLLQNRGQISENKTGTERSVFRSPVHVRQISDVPSMDTEDDIVTPPESTSPQAYPPEDLSLPKQRPMSHHHHGRPAPPAMDMIHESPRRSKSENFNSKPSLPKLSTTGQINNNSSNNYSNNISNLNSRGSFSAKKSPLQGFGLFSRSSSKYLQADANLSSNNYNNNSSSDHIFGRTQSISSSTFKNFTSSLHGKTKTVGGRTIPQKYDHSTNPLLDSTLGLGIKQRASSASLSTESAMSRHIRRTSTSSLHTKHIVVSSSIRRPQVYPAMLSRVATAFRKSITLCEHKKDGLVYRDAFTGQQAIDVICSIIRTNDRNLALLLGRALDAQKLFHDVIYEHRLRDSPNEVYEFTGNSRVIGKGIYEIGSTNNFSASQSSTTIAPSKSESSLSLMEKPEDLDSYHQVNGVFTLLAECYSPTCTRNRLCYSISCPKRLEQQARLNLKPNGGLKRNISMAIDDDDEEKSSWTSSVPEELWSSLTKREIKRQEAIYEVYSTEKKFVKSLEILRDTFMKKLAETNIIPADIRKNFIKHVFAHVNDIYSVNRRLLDALSERQKASPIVDGIGDILLRFVPFFEPFVMYVASRPYAKYLIETQRSVNPYFARFDDDLMNSKLRHGIDSFLSQGVSRPGRYVLLVREIMKSTDPETEKRDLENLTRALEALRAFMKRIDKASGAAQDRHDVKLLKQKILFKNEYVNMGLNDDKRKIKHEGLLSRKEITKNENGVTGDLQFYLLDNMLLFLKSKAVNKWNQHKVFQRPIPLPLLFAAPGEEMPSLKRHICGKPDSQGMVIYPDAIAGTNPRNAISFTYYGAKNKYQVTLYAAQFAAMQTLLEKIKQEQARIIKENDIFNVCKISDRYFDYSNKINSVASCDGGRKLIIATSQGLFYSNIRRAENSIIFGAPTKLLTKSNISQLSVLEEFQSILILADKKLYSCSFDILKITDPQAGNTYFKKHAKELVTHVSFFSDGDCNGKKLIVTAHTSHNSIKYFEHEHPLLHEKKHTKKKFTEVQFDSEPVSISFLKANLCIGCKKGFQIVSVSQNAHEPLLDPADTSLDFALKDSLHPQVIYRVGNMFFLCYTEFAFFVNNQGWRKKEYNVVHWEGEPEKFAIWYPYIIAFDSNFIEIRKVETGELIRCVVGEKIRLLQTSSQEILYVYEDERGYDTIASLDFWGK